MTEVALDIAGIVGDFADYRVALVIASGLSIPPERTPGIEEYVCAAEAEIRAGWGERPVSEVPEIGAWRQAYKGFGIRKTSYRPSVERLIRHIQRHGALPRVTPLVDLYNAVSVKFRMPAGADDLDRAAPPLAFRYALSGDSFIALGDADKREDPPKEGEVVYADTRHVLCRRWNWYQDDRTATSRASRRVVLTVQSAGADPTFTVEAAAGELADLLETHLAGTVRWAVADAATPRVGVAMD